jgi:flagellar protein FliO/FliZ
VREMLVPIFGESGAVAAQYILTFIFVLILVGLAIWAVRRYARGGLGAAARGRLPRLAIVDAMVIDNRRRLVLVRRDNVEHLILIGGPTDLVVEPQIVRTRTTAPTAQRPGQPTQPGRPPSPQPVVAAPAPPPPAPPPPVTPARRPAPAVAEQPIPFAPRRAAIPERATSPEPVAREPVRAAPPEPAPATRPIPEIVVRRRPPPVPEPEPPSDDLDLPLPEPKPLASARFAETARPTRIEQRLAEEKRSVEAAAIVEEAETEPLPLPPPAEESGPEMPPEGEPVPFAAELGDSEAGKPADGSEGETPATAATGEPPAEGEADTAAKVSDLEKEMARLLGEISSRRTS